MARTKEFDRDVVLRKAVAAFRERGFEGTSIQVLVDRMGIHRASLYDTYGSKEQLFREVLEDYSDLIRSSYEGVLASEGTAREVIDRFFDRAVTELSEASTSDGACLMLKTALSGARHLDNVPERVRGYYGWFKGHFERLVARGREEGSIRSPQSDADLADYLLQSLLSVVASVAVEADPERIRRNVSLALEVL